MAKDVTLAIVDLVPVTETFGLWIGCHPGYNIIYVAKFGQP